MIVDSWASNNPTSFISILQYQMVQGILNCIESNRFWTIQLIGILGSYDYIIPEKMKNYRSSVDRSSKKLNYFTAFLLAF